MNMDDVLKFKSGEEEDEWGAVDPRLKGLVITVAIWQYIGWGIPFTITGIIRTPDENEAVGGIIKSAHVMQPGQIWARAVDCRNQNLSDEQQCARRKFINEHWNVKTMPEMFHVIDHDSGAGDHTHINLNYGYMI